MNAAEQPVMPDFCNRHNPFHFVTALSVLEKMGIDTSRVDILAVGEYENYRGEVRTQKPGPGTVIRDDTPLALEVGYPSAVDYMPYQLFYGLAGAAARTGEWENQARALMAPFDAAVMRHLALAVFQALRFSFGMVDRVYLMRFLNLLDFVPFEPTADIQEIVFWSAALPSYNYWAGNPRFAERVLHFLFGYRFRIVENVESAYDIPSDIRSRLGSTTGRLGRTCLLGRSFREQDTAYELQVRRVPASDVHDLLPGKLKRRKLEWVLETCMPNNLECRVRLFVDRQSLVLGEKSKTACVGYSAYV
ncbi:MAG: type VI secretion system baseplate subunit TssG [Candidatus Zixiibacteriota bacterium]